MWLTKWSQVGTCNAKLQLIQAHQSLKSRFSADRNYTAPWLGRQQLPSSGTIGVCKSRIDVCRRQSSPRSAWAPGEGRGCGKLLVALILPGQGCCWGSACSRGIRLMGSVKRGKKITHRQNPHFAQCTVQGWVWDQLSVTQGRREPKQPNTGSSITARALQLSRLGRSEQNFQLKYCKATC